MKTGLEYYYGIIDSLNGGLWVYNTFMIPFMYALLPIILGSIFAIMYYNKKSTISGREKAKSYYYVIGHSLFALFILCMFATPMGLVRRHL